MEKIEMELTEITEIKTEQEARDLEFKFNENELIKYLIEFAEYREGLETITEEEKGLIASYIMNKKRIKN